MYTTNTVRQKTGIVSQTLFILLSLSSKCLKRASGMSVSTKHPLKKYLLCVNVCILWLVYNNNALTAVANIRHQRQGLHNCILF